MNAQLDLPAPDRHGEWHHARESDRSHWTTGPAAVGTTEPDPDGDTVWFRRLGWRRDELPELAAWLLAVHAATEETS